MATLTIRTLDDPLKCRLRLRDAGEALPDAAALFSPTLDMTGASPSVTLNANRDAMFDPAQLPHLSAAYLAGADAAQPLTSPLLGSLAGLPLLLLPVGKAEVLRDDSIRLAQKAREAGVRVELQIFPVVPQVWQLIQKLPEARRSVRAAAAFPHTAQAITAPEELDLLIVGAGLSGIGAAVRLQRDCPEKSFTLLEARAAIGGTWDLFRYPACARIRTCTRWATSSSPGAPPRPSPMARRSATTSPRPPSSTASSPTPAPSSAWSAPTGRPARPAGWWPSSAARSASGLR